MCLEEAFSFCIKISRNIDPPYNTGSAFAHYDDNLEHSTWLNLMKPRLDLLRNLLNNEGSIWISIDDEECHYLKILSDEVFGRSNFITDAIWEKKYTVANDAKYFSNNHDHILVYAKNKDTWKINRLKRTNDMDKAYKNPDNHHKGLWKATPLQAKSGSDPDFAHIFPNGVKWSPPKGRFSAYSQERLDELFYANEIWFGKNGNSIPAKKTFLSELKSTGLVSRTLWRFDEVGHNHEAKSEVKAFNEMEPFATPKPERLIERIITLGSNEGDLVLDSFLGSATTAAVAHKMNRRWIGIELGDQCFTHCKPRLEKVIEGEQGGISKSVNWNGGGGFKFYELAPSLLKQDKYGNWVIDKEQYNVDMLAAAVAKLNGYQYSPDETVFWKQGKGHESSYIYTTTRFVSANYLDMLTAEMQQGENLLICCPAYDEGLNNRYENITIKKIPQAVLDKCEFGARDYNINIGDTTIKESEDMSDE
ncbi:MAG: site-specific DNA-methyltransferase [Desulfitobacteriaceae bacterium]